MEAFVLDETGMVASERIVREVERRGAKLVLVGDAMQRQPIEAGAGFRVITKTIGNAELVETWRQADAARRRVIARRPCSSQSWPTCVVGDGAGAYRFSSSRAGLGTPR